MNEPVFGLYQGNECHSKVDMFSVETSIFCGPLKKERGTPSGNQATHQRTSRGFWSVDRSGALSEGYAATAGGVPGRTKG